jgi:hypothetical protein
MINFLLSMCSALLCSNAPTPEEEKDSQIGSSFPNPSFIYVSINDRGLHYNPLSHVRPDLLSLDSTPP